MQTTTTAANLAHWIQAAPADSVKLRLQTRGEHPIVLLELEAARVLAEEGGATAAGDQIVMVADQWAAGAPGDHYFVVQVIDGRDRPLQSSQFRITSGEAEKRAEWATGSPESVVAHLQGALSGMTKLYQEGWKNLQRGYTDLMTLQQNRIVSLESEVNKARARAEDLESIAEEGIDQLAETERFDKLLGAVQEIARQYQAGKMDPSRVAAAAASSAAQRAAAAVGEAAAGMAAEVAPPAEPAAE